VLPRTREPETVRADRLPGFDGLRGLAATAVLVLHASVLHLTRHVRAQEVVAQLQSGVQVFFVISGFVISRPFVVAVLDGRPLPSIRRYALRRFIRIFPAYWLALVCAWLFFNAPLSGWRDWLTHVLLLQTYSSYQLDRGISIAWTLSVEVSFYVLLPIVFVVIERLARAIGARRALVGGLGALLVVSFVTLEWTAASDRVLPTFWLPFQLPVFVIGMLMCVTAEITFRDDRLRGRLDWIGTLLPLWWAGAAASLLLAAHLYGTTVIFRAQHQLGQEVLYGFMAVCAVLPVAFGFERSGLGGRVLTWRPVAYIGAVSYGVYLWHNQLGEFIADHMFGLRSLDHASVGKLVALVAVSFVAAVAVASVSWFGLERPLQQRSRRW
jgi:peptidoglycan/LPS O-acetylase OafA/YrhL